MHLFAWKNLYFKLMNSLSTNVVIGETFETAHH